jgi:hypothetical protein
MSWYHSPHIQLGSYAWLVSRRRHSGLVHRYAYVLWRNRLGNHVWSHLRSSGKSTCPLGRISPITYSRLYPPSSLLDRRSSMSPLRSWPNSRRKSWADQQDKKDDVLAGVKSMALRFPDNSRTVISTLSATFVSALTLTGHLAGLGPLYYAISCGGAAAHLAWQCITVDFDSRADCWKKFVSNGYLGGLIWAGVAADYLQQVVIPGTYWCIWCVLGQGGSPAGTTWYRQL